MTHGDSGRTASLPPSSHPYPFPRGPVYLVVEAGDGDAWRVVTEDGQTGEHQVDGADVERHASQQHAVVGGQRQAVKEHPQHAERQRGQRARHRRRQDVACKQAALAIDDRSKIELHFFYGT